MRDGYPGWDGQGAFKTITLGATAVQLCEANERRIGLLIPISAASSGLMLGGPEVTSTLGLRITSGTGPLLLSRALHGGMVTRAWWGITSTGAADTLVIMEAFE